MCSGGERRKLTEREKLEADVRMVRASKRGREDIYHGLLDEIDRLRERTVEAEKRLNEWAADVAAAEKALADYDASAVPTLVGGFKATGLL
jgi:hypothetical protein